MTSYPVVSAEVDITSNQNQNSMDREKLQKANEIAAEISSGETAIKEMEGLLTMGMATPTDVVDCFLDCMPNEQIRRLSALAIGMAQERKDFLVNKIERLNKELDEL